MGVSVADTTRNRGGGGARCGYKPEIGIFKRGGVIGTEVVQKEGIWSLFIYYLHF